jgi:hypothetical protein
MYIYFSKINSVLTCEEYPQILSVEVMRKQKLENICNRWEKKEIIKNESFKLFYKNFKETCDCNKSGCECDVYECYNCGKSINEKVDEMYLKNSGHMDIVITGKEIEWCELHENKDFKNIYELNTTYDANYCLHMDKNSNLLSDNNIKGLIEELEDNCYILFVDNI